MSKEPNREAQTFFVDTRFQQMARRPGGVPREQALENAQSNIEERKPEFEAWLDAELQNLAEAVRKGRRYGTILIDPESAQVFLITTISEGAADTLLFGRLKIQRNLISEVELYTNRSRGQGGFQFDPDGPAHFPPAWTIPIGPERRASRAYLVRRAQ